VRTDLDTRSIATFIQAYALGMTLHDLDPKASDSASMVAVIMEAVKGMFTPPDPASASAAD
jgi:hypothetical protein